MAQATFSVRMDEELKKQFDELCREMGMNTSTAINVYARAVVRQRRIPFEVSAPESDVTRKEALKVFNALRAEARDTGVSGMSQEEINNEIRLARAEADG